MNAKTTLPDHKKIMEDVELARTNAAQEKASDVSINKKRNENAKKLLEEKNLEPEKEREEKEKKEEEAEKKHDEHEKHVKHRAKEKKKKLDGKNAEWWKEWTEKWVKGKEGRWYDPRFAIQKFAYGRIWRNMILGKQAHKEEYGKWNPLTWPSRGVQSLANTVVEHPVAGTIGAGFFSLPLVIGFPLGTIIGGVGFPVAVKLWERISNGKAAAAGPVPHK